MIIFPLHKAQLKHLTNMSELNIEPEGIELRVFWSTCTRIQLVWNYSFNLHNFVKLHKFSAILMRIILIYCPPISKSFVCCPRTCVEDFPPIVFDITNIIPTLCFCFPYRRQALRVQPVSETLHEEWPPDEALQDSHKHQEPVSCLYTEYICRQTLWN